MARRLLMAEVSGGRERVRPRLGLMVGVQVATTENQGSGVKYIS